MGLIHWLADAGEMASIIEEKTPGLKVTLSWDASGPIVTAVLGDRRAERRVSWPAVKGAKFNPVLGLLHLTVDDVRAS